MFTSRFLTKAGAFMTILILLLGSVQPAYAAPANDNFADATSITALPYTANTNNVGATGETGEPTNCVNTVPPQSVWFSYTPPTTGALMAVVSYPTIVAVYTGNSVDALGFVNCGPWYIGQFSFTAQAGVTYYFQLTDYFGSQENLSFTLQVAPPPQVSIGYFPGDPSVYDTVSLNANAYDPGQIYGFTYAWSLSDGTTSDQQSWNHQFASDGDYTANLTATTSDGRSATANATIQVRTRDVAITKFSIPQTARLNQTKVINVDISNKRYSDNVRVELYKGLPGGNEQLIGSYTIYVPARASRPTTFKFSYTFTPDDATIGKVTFRAVAILVNGRDSLPADNTAIGTTLVTK